MSDPQSRIDELQERLREWAFTGSTNPAAELLAIVHDYAALATDLAKRLEAAEASCALRDSAAVQTLASAREQLAKERAARERAERVVVAAKEWHRIYPINEPSSSASYFLHAAVHDYERAARKPHPTSEPVAEERCPECPIPGARYMGIGATDEQEQSFRLASFDPLAARLGPGRGKSKEERIHEVALAAGLPDFEGYYGYDFERRQFIGPDNGTGNASGKG